MESNHTRNQPLLLKHLPTEVRRKGICWKICAQPYHVTSLNLRLRKSQCSPSLTNPLLICIRLFFLLLIWWNSSWLIPTEKVLPLWYRFSPKVLCTTPSHLEQHSIILNNFGLFYLLSTIILWIINSELFNYLERFFSVHSFSFSLLNLGKNRGVFICL